MQVSPVPEPLCLPAPGPPAQDTLPLHSPRACLLLCHPPRRVGEEAGCPQAHLQAGGHSRVPGVTPVPSPGKGSTAETAPSLPAS